MRKGFIITLILGLLLVFSCLFSLCYNPRNRSKTSVTEARMQRIVVAFESYQNDWGGDGELKKKLCEKHPDKKGDAKIYLENPSLLKNILSQFAVRPLFDAQGNFIDAWGSRIVIEITADKIVLRSPGQNKKVNDDDDMVQECQTNRTGAK